MAKIKVCNGISCLSAHADNLVQKLKVLAPNHEIEYTGCHGFCSQGPTVIVDDTMYIKVTEKDIPKIVNQHLDQLEVVEELLYVSASGTIEQYADIPFYQQQTRLILANCGHINPDSIEQYIAIGGYEGLKKVLQQSPQATIDEIKTSGLRGRGGAGFPTGVKWQFARNSPGQDKYVIINADEGDPGAFMDRAILEGDPHSVVEGIIIGGYAIGAEHGIIYIRAEYAPTIVRFNKAIADAKTAGFLGKNILNSGFSFEIQLYKGAGAFVCGEETALIKSIEGLRGSPIPKPPFPASSGLWNAPTNINNVKTWSAVSWIMRNGAKQFRTVGTEDSPGTAIFSLTGKVKHSGLVEVPMGTSLRSIIYDIGGGIQNDNPIKAVQTGGPSGGCIPADLLDTPVDYKSMAEVGSIMGSGGMVVIDHDTCIVDFAKFFLAFTTKESCGKCTPCREGTTRIYELLDRISKGEAELSDLDELKELSQVVKDTSLCGLGQTAPNPVLSTLRYFEDEYIEHIVDKKCRAGVCANLIDLEIDLESCRMCGICQDNCPVDAIDGTKGNPYLINNNICIGCKTCISVCPADVINII